MDPTVLEIIKIIAPIIATVSVGWWISQSNEKYKSKIAKQLSRHDLWFSKYTSVIETLLAIVRRTSTDLEKIYKIMDDDYFFRGDIRRQNAEITPLVSKIGSANRELNDLIASSRIYLPDDILTSVSTLAEKFDSATTLFTPHSDEETEEEWVPIDSPDEMLKAKLLILSEIPSLKMDLESRISRSIQAE